MSRHGSSSEVEFLIKATYRVKFDRLIADMTNIHAILHYIQSVADPNANQFAADHIAIANQVQAEIGDLNRLCSRLEDGCSYSLAMTDYQRLWGDCCRFLTRYSLQRLSPDQTRRLQRAVKDIFFRSFQASYPLGLAVWRTCHQDLLHYFCDGPAENGRFPVTYNRRVETPVMEGGYNVQKFVTKMAWSTNGELGRGVRDFVSLPTMRFTHSSVTYHAKH